MAKPDDSERNADPFLLKKTFVSTDDVFAVVVPRLSNLAGDCIFVLDTNALLTPYKVGQKGIADIERVYRTLADAGRLFVPAQVVREFARHRHVTLTETFDHLNKTMSQVPTIPALNCPMLEGRTEYLAVSKQITELKNKISEYKKSLEGLIGVVHDWSWDDKISALYKDVFTRANTIDTSKSDDSIISDLQYRSANNKPPGYKDKAKLDGGVGDLIIWHSICELGKTKGRNVLFVSNEQKPDWVVTTQDRVLAARPELVAEFHELTRKYFSVISYARFLEHFGANKETVGEVRAVDRVVSRSKNSQRIRKRTRHLLASLRGRFEAFLAAYQDGVVSYIADPLFDGHINLLRNQMEDAAQSFSSAYVDALQGLVTELSNLVNANNFARDESQPFSVRLNGARPEAHDEAIAEENCPPTARRSQAYALTTESRSLSRAVVELYLWSEAIRGLDRRFP